MSPASWFFHSVAVCIRALLINIAITSLDIQYIDFIQRTNERKNEGTYERHRVSSTPLSQSGRHRDRRQRNYYSRKAGGNQEAP